MLDGTRDPIYFKSIRKMAIAFATIFNSLWFVREDEEGNVVLKQKIPLEYSGKMHWYNRLRSRDTMTSDFTAAELSTYLPRMSFFLTGIQYDANRQLNPLHRFSKRVSDDLKYKQLMPAPYNINFQLVVYSKNTEDGLMILEQILPLFTPQLNLKIREIEQTDVYSDINIKLQSVAPEDNYLEGFDDNRIVMWNLDFVVEGHIYPPFRNEKIIHKAIIEFDNAHLDPPLEIERVEVIANQTNPPDYDKDNSTVKIYGPDGELPA